MPSPIWLQAGNGAADYTSLTLTLQKGVKFHDGTDCNAEAARYNLQAIADSPSNWLKSVKSVEVVDENTVKINLKAFDNTVIDESYGDRRCSRFAHRN